MAFDPGPFFNLVVQKHLQDRAADRALTDYFIRDAHEQERQKQLEHRNTVRATTQLMLQAYENAKSPAQQELLRTKMQGFLSPYQKDNPELFRYVSETLKGTALDSERLRVDEYDRRHPIPSFPKYDPKEGPERFGMDAFNYYAARSRRSQELYGESGDIPPYVSIDDKQVVLLTQNGPRVTSWEALNSTTQAYAKTYNISPEELIANNYWVDAGTYHSVANVDGQPMITGYFYKKNVLDGSIKVDKQRLDTDFTGSTSGSRGNNEKAPPEVLPEVRGALIYFNNKKLPSKASPKEKAIYNQLDDIMAKYDDDPQRAEYELNQTLRGYDNRHTFLVVGREDEKKYGKSLLGFSLEFGKGTRLLALPGELEAIPTADQPPVPAYFVVDRRAGTVYDIKGTRSWPIEFLDTIRSSTAAQLGLAPHDKENPQPKEEPKEGPKVKPTTKVQEKQLTIDDFLSPEGKAIVKAGQKAWNYKGLFDVGP